MAGKAWQSTCLVAEMCGGGLFTWINKQELWLELLPKVGVWAWCFQVLGLSAKELKIRTHSDLQDTR